jgi:hypothetical protein
MDLGGRIGAVKGTAAIRMEAGSLAETLKGAITRVARYAAAR